MWTISALEKQITETRKEIIEGIWSSKEEDIKYLTEQLQKLKNGGL